LHLISAGNNILMRLKTGRIVIAFEAVERASGNCHITSDVDILPNDNSASESMFAGGFSSCEEIDFGFSDLGDVGPGGCFIAKAAYGSALGPHLDSL